MTEPKLRGRQSVDTVPLKIPGNTISRGNVTVLTPEDFPSRVPEDGILLGRILGFGFGGVIRNPITVEFARVRDMVRPRTAGGPEDSLEVGIANAKDLLRVLEELCGPNRVQLPAE